MPRGSNNKLARRTGHHRQRHPRHVAVTIHGQAVYVDPPVPHLDVLATFRVDLRRKPDGRTRLQRRLEPLRLHLERNPLAHLPPQSIELLPYPVGLLNAILVTLDSAGISYRLTSSSAPRRNLLPVLNPFVPPAARILAQVIETHERAIVELPPGSINLVELCANACTIFGDAQIAIVSENKTWNRSLYNRLKRWRADVNIVRGGLPDSTPRIAIGTAFSMAGHDWEHRHHILIPRARDAVGERLQLTLAEACRAQLIAFTRSCDRYSPHESDILVSRFGFERFVLPRKTKAHLDVQVAFISFRNDRRSLEARGPLHCLQQGVWHCPARNALVGRIALQALRGDFTGISISDEFRDYLGSLGARHVAVLVANPEHAAAVAEHLPGWQTITACLEPQSDSAPIEPQSSQPPTTGTIITAEAAATFDFGAVDIVIRTDAGQSAFPLPTDVDSRWGKFPYRLLLIDFRDRHHAWLHRNSERRLIAYAHRGWGQAGNSASDVLTKDFLAARREVNA